MSEMKRRFSFNPFTWGSGSQDGEVEELDKDKEEHDHDDDEEDGVRTTTLSKKDSVMTGSTSFSVIDNGSAIDDSDEDKENNKEKSGEEHEDDARDNGLSKRHATYPVTEAETAEPRGSFSRWRRFTRHQTLQANPTNNSTSREASIERPRSIEFDLPPLDPVSLDGYSDKTKTRLMTESLSQELRDLLPERLQLYTSWDLCYSLEQHGASLTTLYSNVIPKPQKRPGYLLAIKDKHGDIFGAYVNEYFHIIESRRYYGNGECFLWKTTKLPDGDIRFQAFPYTGVNDFVIFCAPDYLSMGGGDGHYGLWVDDNLEHGVTARSVTFGNELLSSEPNFYVVALEVWRVGPS